MKPATRLTGPAPDLERIAETDRAWFDEHPDEDSYIREFVPREFAALDLPPIPEGFRYATLVSVTHRDQTGAAVGRYRRLLAVCDDPRTLKKPAD
jgi:hypothetical protein